MKNKSIFNILSIALLYVLVISAARVFAIENPNTCSGTITVHAQPNSNGKWCSNGSTGEFTTDATGNAVINSLCNGSYTICIFSNVGGVITSDIVFQGSFYDCYMPNNSNSLKCPCY